MDTSNGRASEITSFLVPEEMTKQDEFNMIQATGQAEYEPVDPSKRSKSMGMVFVNNSDGDEDIHLSTSSPARNSPGRSTDMPPAYN